MAPINITTLWEWFFSLIAVVLDVAIAAVAIVVLQQPSFMHVHWQSRIVYCVLYITNLFVLNRTRKQVPPYNRNQVRIISSFNRRISDKYTFILVCARTMYSIHTAHTSTEMKSLLCTLY